MAFFKAPRRLLLIVYCFKPQVLNKHATNQQVFIWDSSRKRLDAQRERRQRFLWTHSSPEGSCVHPLPAQVSGMSQPLSSSVTQLLERWLGETKTSYSRLTTIMNMIFGHFLEPFKAIHVGYTDQSRSKQIFRIFRAISTHITLMKYNLSEGRSCQVCTETQNMPFPNHVLLFQSN